MGGHGATDKRTRRLLEVGRTKRLQLALPASLTRGTAHTSPRVQSKVLLRGHMQTCRTIPYRCYTTKLGKLHQATPVMPLQDCMEKWKGKTDISPTKKTRTTLT
eukprot:504879-Amphidinium_carterae.1